MAKRHGKKQKRRDSDAGSIVLWFGPHKGTKLSDLPIDSITNALSDYRYKSPEWWVFQGEYKRRDRMRERAVEYASITDRGKGRKSRGSKEAVRRKAEALRKYIQSSTASSLAGQQSPWGVCYPESWDLMSNAERRRWKVNASAKFGETPLGQKIVEVKKPAKHTPVKPAIPQASAEEISAMKFANVARAKDLGVNGTVDITADDCPY